jgi:hypothetical protein
MRGGRPCPSEQSSITGLLRGCATGDLLPRGRVFVQVLGQHVVDAVHDPLRALHPSELLPL